MSAPKTDLDKQEDRHKGPLIGIRGVLIWAGVLLVALLIYYFVVGAGPEVGEGAIDGPADPVAESEPVVEGDVSGNGSEGTD